MSKIVFVEPNLKTNAGHVYSAMLALAHYCKMANKKDDYIFVCHRLFTSRFWERGIAIMPLISKSSFETKSHKPFFTSLMDVIQRCDLAADDLVIICTGHLNELRAVSEICKLKDAPRFVVQLHQFYPPRVYPLRSRERLEIKFEDVLKKVDHRRVRIITGQSAELRNLLAKLSRRSLFRSTVPFLFPAIRSRKSTKKVVLTFLGDGRKEKGLLRLLESVASICDSFPNVTLRIQVQSPRCFSTKEFARLQTLTRRLSSRVELIPTALSMGRYHHYLTSTTAVLLPYDPAHYSMRMSGVAIECGGLGIPIITARGTWMCEQIQKGFLSGTAFTFSKNKKRFTENLIQAIQEFLKQKKSRIKNTKRYQRIYSPSSYIRQVSQTIWNRS